MSSLSDFMCISLVPFFCCLLKINSNKIIKFRMDVHISKLQKVCRVCRGRVNKTKKRGRSYRCTDYYEQFAEVFNVQIASYTKDIHPQFCLSCWIVIGNCYARGRTTPSVGREFHWSKYTETGCRVKYRK